MIRDCNFIRTKWLADLTAVWEGNRASSFSGGCPQMNRDDGVAALGSVAPLITALHGRGLQYG